MVDTSVSSGSADGPKKSKTKRKYLSKSMKPVRWERQELTWCLVWSHADWTVLVRSQWMAQPWPVINMCRLFYTCFQLSRLAPIFHACPQSLETFVYIIFWFKDWQVTVFLWDSQSEAVWWWDVFRFESSSSNLYSTLSLSPPPLSSSPSCRQSDSRLC